MNTINEKINFIKMLSKQLSIKINEIREVDSGKTYFTAYDQEFGLMAEINRLRIQLNKELNELTK
jgi:hypothetical protein